MNRKMLLIAIAAVVFCSSQVDAQLFRRVFQPAPIFRAPVLPRMQVPQFQPVQPRLIIRRPLLQQRFIVPNQQANAQPNAIQGLTDRAKPSLAERQPNLNQPTPTKSAKTAPKEREEVNSILQRSDEKTETSGILEDRVADEDEEPTSNKAWDPSQGYDNDDEVIKVVEPKNDGMVRIRYPRNATGKLKFKVNGVPGELGPGENISIPAGEDFEFSFMSSADEEVDYDVSQQGDFLFVETGEGWKVEPYNAGK